MAVAVVGRQMELVEARGAEEARLAHLANLRSQGRRSG